MKLVGPKIYSVVPSVRQKRWNVLLWNASTRSTFGFRVLPTVRRRKGGVREFGYPGLPAKLCDD